MNGFALVVNSLGFALDVNGAEYKSAQYEMFCALAKLSYSLFSWDYPILSHTDFGGEVMGATGSGSTGEYVFLYILYKNWIHCNINDQRTVGYFRGLVGNKIYRTNKEISYTSKLIHKIECFLNPPPQKKRNKTKKTDH